MIHMQNPTYSLFNVQKICVQWIMWWKVVPSDQGGGIMGLLEYLTMNILHPRLQGKQVDQKGLGPPLSKILGI